MPSGFFRMLPFPDPIPFPHLNPPQTTSALLMNSTTIIDIPPRIIRPSVARPAQPVPAHSAGEDELRSLAQQIVRHDPALALLLARTGERARNS